MCSVLLDNDIVAKAVACNLVEELLAVLKTPTNQLGVLGTLIYVISPKRLRSASDGGETAYERLRSFVMNVHVIEPTDVESRLALVFEEAALNVGADLDTGESQIFAIAVCRTVQTVCTGDKRAIAALEILRHKIEKISCLEGKVVPLEELVRAMIEVIGFERIRERVCAAKGTDTALEICFQCHNENGDPAETEVGLASYISSLRRVAPTMYGDLKACS